MSAGVSGKCSVAPGGSQQQLWLQASWWGRQWTYYASLAGWLWICCCRKTRHCCRLYWRRLAHSGCILGHRARIGRQSVAAQLPKRRELGHCFEQMRGSCGPQHCRWHFCSLNRGGRDPLSNRLGVCHGASVPQRNFTSNIQIGSSSYGHLVHMACVTQSQGHHGRKGKGFCRTLTWGLWRLGYVHVVCHMASSKIESRVALGKGGAAQLLLGSTPQRCVRSWLVL